MCVCRVIHKARIDLTGIRNRTEQLCKLRHPLNKHLHKSLLKIDIICKNKNVSHSHLHKNTSFMNGEGIAQP